MYLEKHVVSILIRDGHPCTLKPVKFGNERSCRFTPYTPEPKWNYYMIHYVFSGRGYVSIGGETFLLKEGDAFFVRPEQNVGYCADREAPWHYAWIGFEGEDADLLATAFGNVFSLPSHIFAPLLQMERFKGTEDYILCSVLYRMVAELLSAKPNQMSYAEQAARYIQNHFEHPLTIASLAELLGITPRYLSSLFKKEYGKTAQEFLLETRLEHAKGLLGIGNSVTEAAYASGYTDAFIFSRAFKRKYGVSPKHCIFHGKEI